MPRRHQSHAPYTLKAGTEEDAISTLHRKKGRDLQGARKGASGRRTATGSTSSRCPMGRGSPSTQRADWAFDGKTFERHGGNGG